MPDSACHGFMRLIAWLGQVGRTWYGTVLLFTVSGTLAGSAVFELALVNGLPRYAVIGMVVGLAEAIASIALQAHRARLRLTKARVKLFGQEAEFVVNAL